MRKLYEIFMILQIQKRIVSEEIIRENTVVCNKKVKSELTWKSLLEGGIETMTHKICW